MKKPEDKPRVGGVYHKQTDGSLKHVVKPPEPAKDFKEKKEEQPETKQQEVAQNVTAKKP